MLTDKENLLRMHRGEMPEFLPNTNFTEFKCSAFVDVKAPGYHKDEFGVEYDGKVDIFGGAPIPIPGRYVLHDITKWRDYIKAPSLEGFDWEQLAKHDLEKIDRTKYGTIFYFGKIFQRLCDFMGFEEGLCAMMEEPEECYALFDYICTFSENVLKNILKYYKPESVCIPDDTATARAPFISLETYRELVEPFHRRIAETALNGGAFIEKHDCGKCELFIPEWMDFGVCAWNPAQPSNDLPGIKKKWGRRLMICGGWDSQGAISFPETDDELMLAELKKYVDTLAPEGGFIFSARVSGRADDPNVQRKNQMIRDFYLGYARDWYKTH